MLNIRSFLLALMCLLVGGMAAASHSQGRESAAHEKAAYSEPQGTRSNPVVIDILSAPGTDQRAKEDKEDRDAKRKSDDDLTKYTGELAIYTARLARYTKFLIVIGIVQCFIFIAQMVIFGIQAKRLRETVESGEKADRPYLVTGDFEADLVPNATTVVSPESEGVHLPVVKYKMYNIGRTPAILDEFRAELRLADDGAQRLPAKPEWVRERPWETQEPIRANTGVYTPIPCEFHRNISSIEAESIKKNTLRFFFFGYIKFRDNFGYLHEKGFGFMITGKNFFLIKGTAYNYEKSEKPPQGPWWKSLFRI